MSEPFAGIDDAAVPVAVMLAVLQPAAMEMEMAAMRQIPAICPRRK